MTLPTAAATSRRLRTAVVAIFVLSGAAGLIYEVVWARELVLVFGNTTQAVSAILTGFFAGLAIGSVLGGWIADRMARTLRMYGFIEIALGAVAVATPILFRLMHEVYRAAYGSLEESPGVLTVVRFALALLVLAPPTILMGASLPTLSRYLARRSSELGVAFGRLYTANTVGALIGTVAAGFVLIELLGLSATLWVGVACSVGAGVAALLLDRGTTSHAGGLHPASEPPMEVAVETPVEPTGPESPRSIRRLALAIAFISGLTSLGYQILWNRLLSSGTGSSTYVFTTILAVFLFGIALGAAVVTARPPRRSAVVPTIGLVQAAIGVLALVGVIDISGAFGDRDFVSLTMIVVVPATLAIGLSLPLAAHLASAHDDHVGRDTGRLLAVNTTGVIVATVGIPFLVIPVIGSPDATVALALLNLATGLGILAWRASARRPGRRAAAWIAAGAVVVAAGILVRPLAQDPSVVSIERRGELWGHREDEIASVQAASIGGNENLLVGGVGMTALTVDARLMPVLPTMLRPDSRSILVICFGMGSSYRTGLILGEKVTGVELVPSVPTFFEHFYPDADAVLADPNGRLVITDGRNHAELSTETYDLAMADPPPPIRSSGTGVLYSREFYEAISRRLNPGGVMMQWIPYDETIADFQAHLRTFQSVFPNVILARGPGRAGVFMLGSTEAIALDDAAIRSVLERPGVVENLSSAEDSPVQTADAWAALIPELVLASGDEIAAMAGSGPLITDDRPLTEYLLLRRLFGPPATPMRPETVAALAGG